MKRKCLLFCKSSSERGDISMDIVYALSIVLTSIKIINELLKLIENIRKNTKK